MPPNFLVIDSDPAGQLLIVRTLKRVFPEATIAKAEDFLPALHLVEAYGYDAIVAHRAEGTDLENLVRCLREAAAQVPLLALEFDESLLAAGATRILGFDEWLMVGAVIEAMLGEKSQTRCQA